MNREEIADYIRNSFTYDDGGISGEVNYLELADWHIAEIKKARVASQKNKSEV